MPVKMLAGLSPPFNVFEIAELRDKILVRVEALPPKKAILYLARGRVAALAESGSIDELQFLSSVCIAADYEPSLFDFYLLECAGCDFEYGPESHHWDVTRENSSFECKRVANEWLAKFDTLLSDTGTA